MGWLSNKDRDQRGRPERSKEEKLLSVAGATVREIFHLYDISPELPMAFTLNDGTVLHYMDAPIIVEKVGDTLRITNFDRSDMSKRGRYLEFEQQRDSQHHLLDSYSIHVYAQKGASAEAIATLSAAPVVTTGKETQLQLFLKYANQKWELQNGKNEQGVVSALEALTQSKFHILGEARNFLERTASGVDSESFPMDRERSRRGPKHLL